jgi:alpha-tubulin suppressor-like RCC1 family protein
MAVGINHTIILTNKGRVFTHGTNVYYDDKFGDLRGSQGLGILGDSEIIDSESPIEITNKFNLLNDEIVVKVFAGYGFHSFALTNKERLFGWGRNDICQITKSNGCKDSAEPIDITKELNLAITETIIDVEISHHTTNVFTSDNRLFTWGRRGFNRNFVEHDSPHLMNQYFELSSEDKVLKFELNSRYSYALISDGRVFYWGAGNNFYNPTDFSYEKPKEISYLFNLSEEEKIIDIKVVLYSAYFITNKGNIYGVGFFGSGPNTTLPIFLKSVKLDSEIFLFDVAYELDKNINELFSITTDSMNVKKLLSTLDMTNLKVEIIEERGINILLLNKNTGELFAWGDNSKDQFFGSEKAFKLWELNNLSNLYSEYFSMQKVYQLNYGHPLINISKNLFHEINLKNKNRYGTMPAKDLTLYLNNTKKEQP